MTIADILRFCRSNVPRTVFLLVLGLATLAGSLHTVTEIARYCRIRRTVPFSFYGDAFNGLGPALQGEKYVGYFTDKDINQAKYGAQFEQAQLALAPRILDLNSTSHRLTIFDCQNPQICQKKMADIKARALKQSSLGTVLALTAPY